MTNETFGDYIKKARETMNLPLRKVAAHLEIDLSTLSKVERGERPASAEYLKRLAAILKLEIKDVQTIFIAQKIIKDFGGMEHLMAGLKAAKQHIKKTEK